MVNIFNLKQIKKALSDIDVIISIEEGFVAYSEDNAIISPIGELIFQSPPGNTHIKYGYIIGEIYRVKNGSE